MKQFSIFWVFWSFSLLGQTPQHQHISKGNGLPTKVVYNIQQDSGHFIWLGTDKGLVRYDGKQFTTYTHPQMRSVGVSDLRFDRNGTLHVQNFSGQHFVLIHDSLQIDTTLMVTGIYSPVVTDPKDNAYQLTYHQLFKNNQLLIQNREGEENHALLFWKDQLYTFNDRFLYSIDSKKDSLTIPIDLSGSSVFFVVQFHEKLMVFPKGAPSDVYYTFFPEFKTIPYSKPPSGIQVVKAIGEELFMGTNKGLYVFDREMRPIPFKNPMLLNSSISDVMLDRDGAIWVSTLDRGLFRFENWKSSFIPVEDGVTAIGFDPGTKHTYLGTAGGKVYREGDGAALSLTYDFGTRQRMTALYFDTVNRLLFMAGDALRILAPGYKASVFELAVKDMVSLDPHTILLGRTGGITWLKHKQSKVDRRNLKVLMEDDQWLLYDKLMLNQANIRVSSMALDTLHHRIYAATSIGLVVVENDRWQVVTIDQHAVAANDLKFRNDTVFIAGNQGVLLLKHHRKVYQWNASNSILPNYVRFLLLHQGDLWAVSGSKLFRIPITGGPLQRYTLTQDADINDIIQTPDGLMLATDDGLLKVKWTDLPRRGRALKLHLLQLRTDQEVLSLNHSAPLAYDNNHLKLTFSVPFYGKEEELKVRYQINEEPWQTAEPGQRVLSLIALQPGNYLVKLKAEAADGRTSEVKYVRFRIAAPFWKTWWFYALSIFAVSLVAFAFYRYRLKLIQHQNQLKEQKMELENKLRESILASVKAQMNPHFVFNALNTIQSFIYQNDKTNATAFLGKFSSLTRTILDMSNKRSVTLREEIDAILLYLELEKMRFSDSFDFRIEMMPGIEPEQLRIPSMIIQPYLENAVKHGLMHKKGERWLRCSFRLENEFLKVTIEDNGIGRKKSEAFNRMRANRHESFATKANEKRLEALNGGNTGALHVQFIDKVSSEGEPEGTVVELTIALYSE